MFYAVQISARARDMTELSQALCGFFFYAAGQPGHALDHDALRAALPGSADWLLEQFEGEESNRKKLKKAVDALFLLPAARRQAVADAVAHDMSFDQAADPARFYFWLPSLPGDERTIVHDFFVYFYETAFSRAVPPQLNGHACQATRAALIADYYRRNPVLKRVCPVCLHQRSKAEAENELDHYFPKAIYPPLAVHPWNLMFICKDCNKTYKGTSDPLSKGKKPLDTVYRPYRDTVRSHTSFSFQWDPVQVHERVRLVPDGQHTHEAAKVSAFSSQFHLEERWSSDLEGVLEQLRLCYSGQGLSRSELQEKLREKYLELRRVAEPAFPDKLLEAEYTAWLCEEQLDAFFANLT